MSTTATALLVMDMQTAILGMLSGPAADSVKQTVGAAIAKARASQIPVIYVTVGFRQGAPEISMNNTGFAANKARFANVSMEEFLKIDPSVAPQTDEIVTVKRRVSAFAGSDLEIVLRAKNIQNLVLTGISTSGVVLSTLREASDKDFGMTVLSDACADHDEEVHRVLTTKIFPRQANVITVAEWTKNIQ